MSLVRDFGNHLGSHLFRAILSGKDHRRPDGRNQRGIVVYFGLYGLIYGCTRKNAQLRGNRVVNWSWKMLAKFAWRDFSLAFCR